MTPVETEIQIIKIPTAILDVINKTLARTLKKNLAEVEAETNVAIERGVKTDETLRDGNSIAEEGRKAIKVTKEVRLQLTRPIDEGKKTLMEEFEKLLARLVASNTILDKMCLDQDAEIQRKKAEKERQYEEERRAAEEEARKKEEKNRNISLAKGGTGDVKPVVAETVERPVCLTGMRSTVRKRSIPDQEKIAQAVKDGIRDIPGVSIYQVWQFSVVDAKIVPKEYRRDVRG